MKTLQIVGHKKVGKTSLLIRLLPLLRSQGLRVASVKHSRNPHALDLPDTDSHRHRVAGAERTLVLTAHEAALHFPAPRDPDVVEEVLVRLLGGADLVLIEGWRDRAGPRIEVVGLNEVGRPDLLVHPDPHDLWARVLGPGIDERIALDAAEISGIRAERPFFRWAEVESLAALVMERLRK